MRGNMGEKLQQGDRFPALTLKLVQGGTMRLPDEMPTHYGPTGENVRYDAITSISCIDRHCQVSALRADCSRRSRA
jgi:hypothetical protein